MVPVFLELLSNLTRFSDASDSISISKEHYLSLVLIVYRDRQSICNDNQPLTRSKEINNSVCDTFEHFWKTEGYDICLRSWTVVKERINSGIQILSSVCISDLRTSMYALRGQPCDCQS